MVMANLHVICGVCGCNNEFQFYHVDWRPDDSEDTVIKCENCGTNHRLSDNAKLKEQP